MSVISTSFSALNINDTFASFLSAFLLSCFTIPKLPVCFKFNAVTSKRPVPFFLSVFGLVCLFISTHPRFAISSTFVDSLLVTVPSLSDEINVVV